MLIVPMLAVLLAAEAREASEIAEKMPELRPLDEARDHADGAASEPTVPGRCVKSADLEAAGAGSETPPTDPAADRSNASEAADDFPAPMSPRDAAIEAYAPSAPLLRRRAPQFRLLEPRDAAASTVPCLPGPLELVLAHARVKRATTATNAGFGDAPWVWSEVGLRTAAHWGIVGVYADGLARLDVQAPVRPGAPVRARLTPRQRVGLSAAATEELHLGVEFSRRAATGADSLASEARAAAHVKLRFGL